VRYWQIGRWVLLVVWALALALFLARVFSGPEDTYIRDASGKWVAHGHPAGPPPAASYQPPASERAVPTIVVALFAVGLMAAVFLSGRSPTGTDSLNRGIRYFGAVSIISTALAVCVAIGLVAGVFTGLGAAFQDPGLVILCLVGTAMLLKLLSWHADSTKKVLEAHYDLKRQMALLQDAVERLGAAGVQSSGGA